MMLMLLSKPGRRSKLRTQLVTMTVELFYRSVFVFFFFPLFVSFICFFMFFCVFFFCFFLDFGKLNSAWVFASCSDAASSCLFYIVRDHPQPLPRQELTVPARRNGKLRFNLPLGPINLHTKSDGSTRSGCRVWRKDKHFLGIINIIGHSQYVAIADS